MILATMISIIMGWLRPYQRKWLEDQSRFKVGLMSRQVGKSEVISLEAVLLAMEKPKSPEQVVLLVSSGDFQARELLRKVTRWTDLFDAALKRVLGPRATIYAEKPTSQCLTLISGQRIISHSANPRTLAGFTGHVIWDEAGRTPFDALMYEALMPITDEGDYSFRMTGTPWGDKGVFHDVCVGGKIGEAKLNWSKHKVTIVDAVAAGLRRDIEMIKSMFDPLTFAQDYLCEFTSAANQVFSRDLIMACMGLDLPIVPFDNKDLRRALGVDVGRTHDKTSEIWTAEYPDGYYQVERVQQLRNMPFNEQKAIIAAELNTGRIMRSKIDKTGLGMQMAEELEMQFPGVVEGVMFTGKVKEELVALVLSLAQSKRLKILPDNDLISDLSSIRREYSLKGGGVLYDAERNASGHADSFWALGLSLSCLTTAPDWRFAVYGDSAPREVNPVIMVGQETQNDLGSMMAAFATDSDLPMVSELHMDPLMDSEFGLEDDVYGKI